MLVDLRSPEAVAKGTIPGAVHIPLADLSSNDPRLAEAFLQIGADRFRELIQNHREQTKRLAELPQLLKSA